MSVSSSGKFDSAVFMEPLFQRGVLLAKLKNMQSIVSDVVTMQRID